MNEEAPRLSLLSGRYVLGEPIGRGGAATVHLGKPVGAGRRGVVAIKRLHPHLAADPAFAAMMLDEARLLSHVRHPNVVTTLDVVLEEGQLYIVMEYVHGLTLGTLLGRAHAKRTRAPVAVACAIARDALLGLHAAHEATGSAGEPLGMVHRDVSPQNLLLTEGGTLKVVDFGIAKAEGRVQHTEDGSIKGKLGYMPPEQLFGDAIDRRSDVYAAGVVLWETLAGERLFAGENDAPALVKSLVAHVDPPSSRAPQVGEEIDRIVLRALSHDRAHRFQTANEMASALGAAIAPAPPAEVAAWIRSLAGDVLDERGARLFVFDRASREMIADLPKQRETLASMQISPAPQRRTWTLAIAAVLCAAAGGAAAMMLNGPAPARLSVDPPESAGGVTASAQAVLISSASSEPTAEPPASTSTSSTPAATASATSENPTTAPETRPTASIARTAAAPHPTAKPAPKADGCDPPFTIDAQGHKRYKRACLR